MYPLDPVSFRVQAYERARISVSQMEVGDRNVKSLYGKANEK
jgi:hypothetical protein